MEKMAITLCMLLVICCVSPRAHAALDSNALTSTSTYTLANIAKAHTSAVSCASTSASSTSGGSSSATAASNAAAIGVAASSCAKAISDAFGVAGADCDRADVSSLISLSATACARSTLAIRTGAIANAASTGRAAAFASACSTSTAYSASFAKAIAKAVSVGFSSSGGTCGAFTNTTGDAKVQAVASTIAKGLASSYAYAASRGQGASRGVTSAMFTADVSVYAKAIGELFSYGCANCNPKACSYCSQLPDGDDSTSKTMAVASKGRFALASAFSDAVSSVCLRKLSIKAATQASLQAVGDACVQMTATAKNYLTASGNAISCTNSFVEGSTFGLSKAFGSLVAEAIATAFQNDDCATKAFAAISAEVFSDIQVLDVVSAMNKACVASQGGFFVSFSSVSQALYQTLDQRFSNAISNAIGSVESNCECSGVGYCCNCAERSPTCPY